MDNKEELKEINIAGSLIELLLSSNQNNQILGAILKRQIEIKELIKKTPKGEFENNIKDEIAEIERKLTESSLKERKILNDFVLKSM